MPVIPRLYSWVCAWVRTYGLPSLVLALLFFTLGHVSFLVQVDHSIVTSSLFFPEAIDWAMQMSYGPAVWPGTFAGQLFLCLSRGLPILPSLSIAFTVSLGNMLGVLIFRRLRLDARLLSAKDLAGLMLLVFLFIQPLNATLSNLALLLCGAMKSASSFPSACLQWWAGDVTTQVLLTPPLLVMLTGQRSLRDLLNDFLISVAVILPMILALNHLVTITGVASTWIIFLPAVVLMAIYRGLAATSLCGFTIAMITLYGAHYGLGPFAKALHSPQILDLNVFIVGLTMTGQFLAVLLEQSRRQSAQLESLREREKNRDKEYRLKLESKLKSSLIASVVAHEINQPLSAILLQSKISLRDGSDAQKALEIIAEESQRVVSTIDKMKSLLRTVETIHSPTDLGQLVKSTLLYNKGLINRNGIEVIQTGLTECLIDADDAQIQIALTNLIRNAVEAILEGDPSAEKLREISIDIRQAPECFELIVGDSGVGWPEGVPEGVPLTTTKADGSGIGLFVVRTAMENHGGSVSFGISPLGGAEVKLHFPRVVSTQVTADRLSSMLNGS